MDGALTSTIVELVGTGSRESRRITFATIGFPKLTEGIHAVGDTSIGRPAYWILKVRDPDRNDIYLNPDQVVMLDTYVVDLP